METPLENSQTLKKSNVNLIYSFTEYRLKLANDSLNALNAKLGSIIAFSGAAIGFSINLPNKPFLTQTAGYICYSCLTVKILVCVSLIVSICVSVRGFYPLAGGAMTPPSVLMDEYYFDSEENCRLVIIKTWLDTLEELESMRDIKADYVKKSVFALGGAAVLAASDIVLASYLSIL